MKNLIKERGLIVLGYAGHGKTTATEYLADYYDLSLKDASDYIAEEILVKGGIYKSVKEAYDKKPQEREIWYNEVVKYVKDDPARLLREVLNVSDLYCGCRGYDELQALKDSSGASCPLIVWIMDPRKPKESTKSCTVTPEQAHVIINSDGDLEMLYKKLRNLKPSDFN